MLTAAGLGWQHVVKTVEFIRPEALERYRETGRVRRDLLGPAYPVATGIVMPRTAHDDALIQMDFVASFAPKQVIEVPWERFRHLTYAPAVRAGRHLCVAGIAPLDPETAVVQHPGDVVAQTRYVYGILAQILAAAGASMDAVVKTVEYVTPEGLPHYRETAAIRQELFTRPHPAATGVVCERLLRPGMTVEVDAWAIID